MIELLEKDFPLPLRIDRPLVLGVIGCGRMFRNCHAQALLWLRSKEWKVSVGVLCDPDPEAMALAAKLFPEARCYTDYKLMPCDCDAFLVQLWAPASGEAARWLLERGRPFMIEKPVSHDDSELSQLAELAETAGIPAMVGYNRRFQAGAGEFRNIVAQIKGNKIFQSRFLREHRSESIFYEDVLGHPLDFLMSVVGELSVESVKTWGPETPHGIPSGMRIETTSHAGDCQFEIIPACGRNAEFYECHGHEESVSLCYHPLEKLAAPPELVRYTPGLCQHILSPAVSEFKNKDVLLHIQGFVLQMANFIRLVGHEDAGPYCSLRSALATTRLINKVIDMAGK